MADVARDGAECVCWKENDNVPPRANESICPKHRGNVDVPTAWEMLRLAAGYFQAIEEQLRPLLDHPDTTEEFRLSAYGTAMETAANIAKHQRANIVREGVEAARIQVSVVAGDMRGENALAWLAGQQLGGVTDER